MRRLSLCGMAAALLACSADAGVIIRHRFERIDGFDVFTLRAVSDVGSIRAFDFEGDATVDDDLGFFGDLNQINPFGLPTVFGNNNVAITATGGDVGLDSQFLFNGADSPSVTVPDGFANESQQRLSATFAAAAPLGDSVEFARVVSPQSAECVRYRGVVVVGDGFEEVLVEGVSCLPEPVSSPLLALAVACFACLDRDAACLFNWRT